MFDKNDVKAAVNILDVVGDYGVKLQRVGAKWQGLCPLHQEDMPSFTVYPETGSFFCFGCDEGGDIFDLVMLKENISFPEAVEKLGRRVAKTAGLANTPKPPKTVVVKPAPDKAALDMFARAYNMARDAILNDTGADAVFVRRYLAERGFEREDIGKLRIGAYLPIHREYFQKNYRKDLADQSGLVSYGKGYNYQILFPQYDKNGIVVGLTFRLTREGTDRDNKPLRKYKFTPLYDKDYPFNLFFAAKAIKAAGGDATVVEGHVDVEALIIAGIENASGLGGHYLSEEHIDNFVDAGAKNLFLWLDNDGPGLKGCMEGVKTALHYNRTGVYVIESSYKDVGEINKLPEREKRVEDIKGAIGSNVFGSVWLGKKMANLLWSVREKKLLPVTNARDRQRSLEEAKEVFINIKDVIQKRQFLKAFSKTAGFKLGDLERTFLGDSRKKPAANEAAGLVLLQRLDGMFKSDGFDMPAAQRYLAAFYAETKRNKKLTRDTGELVAAVNTLLRHYQIEGLRQFVSMKLSELGVKN